MKIRLLFVGMCVLLCTWVLNGMARSMAQAPAPAAKEAVSAEDTPASKCLSCHGPFDKIVAGSANYTTPSGDKVNPHRHVPHDSKNDDDIPACSNCHVPHPVNPLPAPGSIDTSKVNVQWCYEQCHHAKNFSPCKTCHVQ